MQCLFGQLAFFRHMQAEELTASMGHAADFGDVQLEAGLVTCEVIADQLAAPGAKEVTCMFPCMAGTEVVDYEVVVQTPTGEATWYVNRIWYDVP